ncbi:hypothetical protein CEP54_004586 [Fusarium duplospermum]|uniref:Zn(2)-C6 fungal-type domain-containing protein n=1 Tax=Fusarium duplospermum TaxID=1325734 RepID=A0A428QHK5_9HYPO|nr:hypothetical protein CEP54_004586 [Fusarium duplospermum]
MSPTKSSRYSTSRQKACQACSAAKAKCDRRPETCGRCALRGLDCHYAQSRASNSETRDTGPFDGNDTTYSLPEVHLESLQLASRTDTPSSTVHSIESVAGNAPGSSTHALPLNQAIETNPPRQPELDFSGLELVCPINSDDIKNRWLNTYVPFPGQTLKDYSPSLMGFVYRILKSYASVVVRGRGIPPFIHFSQITPAAVTRPLSTCLSLVRICENSLPGSEGTATDILQREMANIYEQHGTYDGINLLAAFQAYLIYALVLYFYLTPSQGPAPFLRQAIINLQEIACTSSQRGLVCVAEQDGIRPKWEAWIIAEAKRRTLYTMYFLDNVLSAQDGLPTYLGSELRGLPAPSSKTLWQGHRHDWEATYNVYLAEWAEGNFRIDELWPLSENSDESVVKRRDRVDRWLEGVDEFGTMLYAVTSCTHGT